MNSSDNNDYICDDRHLYESYDKIRSMTDEEFEKYLIEKYGKEYLTEKFGEDIQDISK